MKRSVFHEEQRLQTARVRTVLAVPPAIFLALVVWQVVLRHPWGRHPMSNANLIGWTIFLWLLYGRLMTVKLVTDLWPDKLSISMRGLWRVRHIPITQIEAVQIVSFNAAKEFGGYGIRSTGPKKAYVASGDRGVSLKVNRSQTIIVGSQHSEELAKALNLLVGRVRQQ